jgi:GNAT superfamily N-acetyltransferase
MPAAESGIQIRPATTADVPAMVLVLQRAFVEFEHLYTAAGFAATVLDEENALRRMAEGPSWVAERGDAILGTASAVDRAEKGLYVRGMAVVPEARGLKIGASLLRLIEDFALEQGHHRLFLSTTPFLSGAIRLYKRFGFARTEHEPQNLYGTPVFTMTKELKLATRVRETLK